MKIGINARLLHEPSLRGWNRYTVNLLAELNALGVDLVLLTDREPHESHLARLVAGRYEVRVSPKTPYILWEQRWLPDQCTRDSVDLLHCPFNFGLPWSSRCPRVLTLHDAIDYVFTRKVTSDTSNISYASLMTRFHHFAARSRAHKVITVSEHARGDLWRHLRIPIERIVVTPEAADPIFHQPVADQARRRVRSLHRLDRPYFFYVGGWEERKNIPFLLNAFAMSGLEGVELVLAGGKDDQRAELTGLAAALGVNERVRLLGWVEDADLPGLYAEAIGFVYPSRYEGFGLQLCEAMAVGCPTLAARATSLPEVLGDGGLTFTLESAEELASLMRRLAESAEFREELSGRARKRSSCFDWRKTAELTIAVYESVMSGGVISTGTSR